jgi:hypothetical protein
MLRKICVLAISMATISHAMAQDIEKEKPKPVITGSADVYYRYNFSDQKNDPYNNFTSFTNSHNSFELGMASIKVEHSVGKVGMVADFGFGRRAQEFSYVDGDKDAAANGFFSQAAIKQLYVTYAPSDKVTFTFGSFGTHVGYELLDAYLNRNYSMSYGFSYGPFFHTGLKADISLGGQSGLMVGITNPTDLKTASGMPKMFIGQFSTGSADDKFNVYLNFQGGKYDEAARLFQGDVTASYAISDKFSLGFNGTLQSRSIKNGNGWEDGTSWWGTALYVNADPNDWFGLTLRGEYFNDEKNVLGFNSTIFSPTLSFNFKLDNLTIIPEFRFDSASENLFEKKAGDPTKSTASFILAATYHF